MFAQHPQSPIPVDERPLFDGLSYFPYDPSLRFEVEIQPAAEADLEVDHSSAGVTTVRRFGAVRFEIGGTDVTLCLYWLAGYGGGVFLPFRDGTNGTETYAQGRYVLDTVKGADLGSRGSRTVLDFNYAYHPSCVHSDTWSCPLAPPENHLTVPIPAGEKLRTLPG